MSTTRIAHFENNAQAEAAREFLIKRGIKAEIHAESGLAKLWFVSRHQAGVRLEVPGQETARSLKLLGGEDTPSRILRDAVRCPECHSLRVDFPQFTRKSLLTNLVMGLLAEIHFLERNYYCEHCHCMWAKPGVKRTRVRRHLAPDFFLEDLAPRLNINPKPGNGRESERAACGRGDIAPSERATRTRRLLNFRIRWRRTLPLILPLQLCLLISGGRHDATADPVPLFANTARSTGASPASAHQERPTYLRDVLPILMGKCGRCHNEETSFLQNWLDYSVASHKRWEIKRRVWDSWHGAYFKQPMPTGNSPESLAITQEERATIRDWVESGAEFGVAPPEGSAESKAERIEAGKRLFASICAACHQPGGQGIPGRFPPLARSDFLNSDKHRAIKIVVNGFQGEVVVNGQEFNNSMPKFPLSDQDIASALTYVYNSFGNSGKDITAPEVRAVRGEKNDLVPIAHNASPLEDKSPFE